MRPGLAAAEIKIIGVGPSFDAAVGGAIDRVVDAVFLSPCHGFIGTGETEVNRLHRITGRLPAHEPVWQGAVKARIFQHPVISAGTTGLHRCLGFLVNPCTHDIPRCAKNLNYYAGL